jgi:hypothetical protein
MGDIFEPNKQAVATGIIKVLWEYNGASDTIQ